MSSFALGMLAGIPVGFAFALAVGLLVTARKADEDAARIVELRRQRDELLRDDTVGIVHLDAGANLTYDADHEETP